MILDFPNSPATDAIYTGTNGTTYQYDGIKWVGIAGESGGISGPSWYLTSGTEIVSLTDQGILTLPHGGTISDTTNTTVISPPGADAGQGLVIRPTAGGNPRTITVDHPDGFVPGETITITFSTPSPNIGYTYLAWEIVGLTPEQLGTPPGSDYYAPGQSTTGTLVVYDTGTVSLTWTIPEGSDMTSFTLTILYTNFGNGGDAAVTVTLDGHYTEQHGHLHLVAGNPTNYDLYLGDDDQYVKIEKNAGNVVIGTNTNTNQWTFGTDGTLTLPGNYSIGPGEGSLGIISESAVAIIADSSNSNQLWIFGTDGKLQLPSGGDIVDSNGTTVLGGGTADTGSWTFDAVTATTDGNIIVKAGSGTDAWASLLSNNGSNSFWVDDVGAHVTSNFIEGETSENYWTFGTDGVLTLPDANLVDYPAGVISFNFEGNNFNQLRNHNSTVFLEGVEDAPPGYEVYGKGAILTQLAVSNNDVIIHTNMQGNVDLGNTWTFGADGSLVLPTAGIIQGIGTGTDVIIESGPYGWTFTENGVLTLPSTIGDIERDGYSVLGAAAGPRWYLTSSTAVISLTADGTLTAPGHIIPNADRTYDLGSTSSQWRSLYVGTGTIYIGGVALGVNENNYVTVDGNPIITVNTAGNLTVQGGTNVIGSVVVSDTAPVAATQGAQWFNTVDGRTYIAYNEQWVDTSPTQIPSPETYLDDIQIDGSTLSVGDYAWTFGGATDTFPGDIYDAEGPIVRFATTSTAPARANGQLWFNSEEGRTYIKYNDAWVDANPTQIPSPETYLDDIQVDGSEFLINGYSLTVDETGTLLVDGQQVTGSGAATDSITSGSYSVSVADTGVVTMATSRGNVEFGALPEIIGGPSHFHIMKSSEDTGMDLFFGDDYNYVLQRGNSQSESEGHLNDYGVEIGTRDLSTGTTNQYVWRFETDGVLTLSTASTILGNSEDPNVYIETSTTATTSTWTFGTNGILTLPADTPIIKGGGTGTDVTIVASTGTNPANWTFGADGTTLFPNAAIDGGTAPIELKSRSWSQLTYNNADMTPATNTNHSTTFYVEGGGAQLEIFRWDGDSVLQHRQWSFSNDGTLTLPDTGTITFPDATVQRSAYLTGQQTVHINTASTTTSIDLTELTGSIVMLYPEAGYTASGETHYVNLPFDTNSIALGTRITVLNYHPGNAIVSGWDGPGYTMSQFETIDLVYTFDPGYPGNIWWVTSSFVW